MNLSVRVLLALGAVNGALVVALGAYGAHALKDQAAALMQTAVQYHMFHALGLLAIGVAAALKPGSALFLWAAAAMLLGIVLFCGTIYVHALTGYRGLSPVTPLGGTAFMAAWLLFAAGALRG
ncbi:MAG TPA: DUF423 domain-containing protein [Burkholderiales bacterium]